MDDAKENRRNMVVTLKPAAKATLATIKSDTGVAKSEALSRLIEWYASQDRKIRIAILSGDNDTKHEMLMLMMRQMAVDTAPTSAASLIGPQAVAEKLANFISTASDEDRDKFILALDAIPDAREKVFNHVSAKAVKDATARQHQAKVDQDKANQEQAKLGKHKRA